MSEVLYGRISFWTSISEYSCTSKFVPGHTAIWAHYRQADSHGFPFKLVANCRSHSTAPWSNFTYPQGIFPFQCAVRHLNVNTKTLLSDNLTVKEYAATGNPQLVDRAYPFYRLPRALRVRSGIALLFLGSRHTKCGRADSSTPRAIYARVKTRYPLYRRMDGSQGGSGHRDSIPGPSSP